MSVCMPEIGTFVYSCYLGRFRRYVIQTKLDQSESVAQNPDLFVYFVRKILNNISARGGC